MKKPRLEPYQKEIKKRVTLMGYPISTKQFPQTKQDDTMDGMRIAGDYSHFVIPKVIHWWSKFVLWMKMNCWILTRQGSFFIQLFGWTIQGKKKVGLINGMSAGKSIVDDPLLRMRCMMIELGPMREQVLLTLADLCKRPSKGSSQRYVRGQPL